MKLIQTITLIPLISNLTKDFYIEIDASTFAISAVLIYNSIKSFQAVQYFSCKLKNSETRYALHEHDRLAIIIAFDKFKLYI